MNIKTFLKRIFGEENLSNLKGQFELARYEKMINASQLKRLFLEDSCFSIFKQIAGEEHYFRGYYDIDYFNIGSTRFLCHRLSEEALSGGNRKNTCEVGYYDIATEQYRPIARTQAWCWQQGSRLRWNPINDNQIVFNAIDRDNYCSKVYDIETKQEITRFPRALYDINNNLTKGYSLNFSRLQRLRPGYGYDFFEDQTRDQPAPSNDGLFGIDLVTGRVDLLWSLAELADRCDASKYAQHYLNHISVSPDGSRVMFFHIFLEPDANMWNVCFYACDADGSNLTLLESNHRASHYCWIDNRSLLVTLCISPTEEYYALVDAYTGEKKPFLGGNLTLDGHPSCWYGSKYITDTYPKHNNLQRLLLVDSEKQTVNTIASFFHDPRLRRDKRVDLHPSISSDKRYVSVDTCYAGKRRQIVILKAGINDNLY